MIQNIPYKEHREPLTKDGRSALKMGFVLIGIFTIFYVGIFSFAFALVIDMEKGWYNWPVYIVAAFAAIFGIVIIAQIYRVIQDLMGGEQAVLNGRISEKSEYKSDSKSSRTPKYYLHFGNKKIEVKLNYYKQAKEQDLVELRYAPHSKYIFSVETLESGLAAHEETKARWFPRRPEQDTRVEMPLTLEDRKTLKKSRNRSVFHRVFMLLFSGYFFIGFALSELWGLVLLMSPMIVVFVYQAKKLVKTFSVYRQDMDTGYKTGRTVQVSDKQMRHRRGKHYFLLSGKRSLTVDQAVFDIISVGDRITEYSGKHSGIGIEVVPAER